MIKIIFTSIFFFLGVVSTTNVCNVSIPPTKEKLQEAVINYATLIEASSGRVFNRYITEVDLVFIDPYNDDHVGDLFDYDFREARSYVSEIQKKSNISKVEFNTLEAEYLDCNFLDETTGRSYTIVKLNKNVYEKGNKNPLQLSQYLRLDISNSQNPMVSKVFDSDTDFTEDLSTCNNAVEQSQEEQQKAARALKLKEETIAAYSNKNYVIAWIKINEVISINPSDEEAQSYEEAIKEFLTEITIEIYLEKEVEGSINSAKNVLNQLAKNNIVDNNFSTKWQSKILKLEIIRRQKFEFEKAENLVADDLHMQAFPVLNKLKQEGFQHPNLNRLIQECRDADPEIVKKRIDAAYKAVVDSKRNANETFKTYYRYENSGLLSGSNLRFMCQIMLSRGNKNLLKDMDISPNQAKNLAIKYFFKAKELGQDMNDIEVMVFTQNFDKK